MVYFWKSGIFNYLEERKYCLEVVNQNSYNINNYETNNDDDDDNSKIIIIK
jgi:hypothetical protein